MMAVAKLSLVIAVLFILKLSSSAPVTNENNCGLNDGKENDGNMEASRCNFTQGNCGSLNGTGSCTNCSSCCNCSERCNNDKHARDCENCTCNFGNCSHTCPSCTDDCGNCTNDCGNCTAECGNCTNECGNCTNDCSNCTSDCESCTSDCDAASGCGLDNSQNCWGCCNRTFCKMDSETNPDKGYSEFIQVIRKVKTTIEEIIRVVRFYGDGELITYIDGREDINSTQVLGTKKDNFSYIEREYIVNNNGTNKTILSSKNNDDQSPSIQVVYVSTETPSYAESNVNSRPNTTQGQFHRNTPTSPYMHSGQTSYKGQYINEKAADLFAQSNHKNVDGSKLHFRNDSYNNKDAIDSVRQKGSRYNTIRANQARNVGPFGPRGPTSLDNSNITERYNVSTVPSSHNNKDCGCSSNEESNENNNSSHIFKTNRTDNSYNYENSTEIADSSQSSTRFTKGNDSTGFEEFRGQKENENAANGNSNTLPNKSEEYKHSSEESSESHKEGSSEHNSNESDVDHRQTNSHDGSETDESTGKSKQSNNDQDTEDHGKKGESETSHHSHEDHKSEESKHSNNNQDTEGHGKKGESETSHHLHEEQKSEESKHSSEGSSESHNEGSSEHSNSNESDVDHRQTNRHGGSTTDESTGKSKQSNNNQDTEDHGKRGESETSHHSHEDQRSEESKHSSEGSSESHKEESSEHNNSNESDVDHSQTNSNDGSRTDESSGKSQKSNNNQDTEHHTSYRKSETSHSSYDYQDSEDSDKSEHFGSSNGSSRSCCCRKKTESTDD